jgi:RHS repeat-associated protein
MWAVVLGMLLWVGATLPQAEASVSVTLTAPANGALFTAPANITLTATATAAQGYTVSKVEFFRGSTLIGTATTAPYSFNWTNVPAGSYAVTAKATAIKKSSPDQTATSALANITVNALPTVSLTSPANNVVFAAPANITLSATAADSDGTVSKVEFFRGTTLIGTVTSAPYTFNWTNVTAGPYTLTAKVTDNRNATTTSAAVNITVDTAPTVSITSPANNAVFTAPANITLASTASDSDGSIQKVDFFRGGSTLIGTATSAPYSFNWTNVQAGPYTLTAVATDNLGVTTTSSPVTITVNQGVAQVYFIHTDHLNTPRLITNQAQQVVWRWDNTEPFGNSVPDENPSGLGTFTCNLRFAGQYFDKETNLHYNMARDYDPAIGRYMQSDPIGLRGGINTYTYVGGNPLRFTDPTGLSYIVSEYGYITVYTDSGAFIASYPASNTTTNPAGDPNTVGSNGPAPTGIFPVQPPVNTAGRPEYGPYFFPVGSVDANGRPADIARERGIGIHAGRRGFGSVTQGCFRVDDSTARDLYRIYQRDPIRYIEIQ